MDITHTRARQDAHAMQTIYEGCLNLVSAVKLLAEDAQQSESNPRKVALKEIIVPLGI